MRTFLHQFRPYDPALVFAVNPEEKTLKLNDFDSTPYQDHLDTLMKMHISVTFQIRKNGLESRSWRGFGFAGQPGKIVFDEISIPESTYQITVGVHPVFLNIQLSCTTL